MSISYTVLYYPHLVISITYTWHGICIIINYNLKGTNMSYNEIQDTILRHKTNMVLANDHGDIQAYRYHKEQLIKTIKLLKPFKRKA